MVNSKNLLGNKVLLLLAFVLFAIGFSIINNVFLVFGQMNNPQWRGTNNVKAPNLAENLEWLKKEIENLKNNNNSNSPSLSCTTVSSPMRWYSDGEWAAAYCPTGYIRTGGGCRFNYNAGHRRVTTNQPIGSNGWYCVAGLDPGWRTQGYAYVICCKIQ